MRRGDLPRPRGGRLRSGARTRPVTAPKVASEALCALNPIGSGTGPSGLLGEVETRVAARSPSQ
jgi:hypothetical protein